MAAPSGAAFLRLRIEKMNPSEWNMINEILVTDFLGDEWALLAPVKYKVQNGYTTMWAWVMKGPAKLTTPPYNYQELPFPVFTDWWPK